MSPPHGGFPSSSEGRESAYGTGETQVQFQGREDLRRKRLPTSVFLGFLCGSAGKESTCNEGDPSSIPGLGRSTGKGIDYPFQYSGLENSMDCIVYGIAESDMTE